ncbi:MAG TPA: hypothetical protein VEW48_24225 [Thermoanaerobaculia bacterium]|nr:hypothetical protein [Thermoanaerobaculia bacterium]
MRTWDDWFAYLDGLVDPRTGGQLPDIRDFLQAAQRCRSEMSFSRNDLRLRILDELWRAALNLVYPDKQAAEVHRRSAALLSTRWKAASGGRAAHPARQEPGTPDRPLQVFLNRIKVEAHRKRHAMATT